MAGLGHEAEAVALWPLILLRAAVLTASVEKQLAIDPGNDYAAAERRMQLIIQQSAPDSEDPADAAAVLVATTEAEELENFRIIVGDGGKMFADGRARTSDQDMLKMVAAETDEEYFALFAQFFAPTE